MNKKKIAQKAASGAGKAALWLGGKSLKGLKKGAATAYAHRKEIGHFSLGACLAAGSGIQSVAGTAHDSLSLLLYKNKTNEELKEKINRQAREYQALIKKNRADHSFMDSIAVGGDLLADIVAGRAEVNPEIVSAYEAANPVQASEMTFTDAVRSYNDSQLPAFISRVKGKLFEMQYVDYLNNGVLPAGYTAELAGSATQPGWDIAVRGPDGDIAEVIQAKATDSVAYVREALEKYPDIDVVTTEEVYSGLVMNGTDMVTDSGVTDAALTEQVTGAVDSADISMDWTPPLISLALIAFTTYSKKDMEGYQKARILGERYGKSYVACLVGGGVSVLTQTWWLGLLAGVGSRYLAGRGKRQRLLYKRLKQMYKNNAELIDKMRESI